MQHDVINRYHDDMIRTQVQLTEKQVKALKRAATNRGASISALIREAIDHMIEEPSRDVVWQRAVDAIGRLRSDRANVSEEHDRYLADAYRR